MIRTGSHCGSFKNRSSALTFQLPMKVIGSWELTSIADYLTWTAKFFADCSLDEQLTDDPPAVCTQRDPNANLAGSTYRTC